MYDDALHLIAQPFLRIIVETFNLQFYDLARFVAERTFHNLAVLVKYDLGRCPGKVGGEILDDITSIFEQIRRCRIGTLRFRLRAGNGRLRLRADGEQRTAEYKIETESHFISSLLSEHFYWVRTPCRLHSTRDVLCTVSLPVDWDLITSQSKK